MIWTPLLQKTLCDVLFFPDLSAFSFVFGNCKAALLGGDHVTDLATEQYKVSLLSKRLGCFRVMFKNHYPYAL